MTIKLSTGLRTGMCGTVGFAEAFANGVIHIYSGPQPNTADAAASGTLLGVVTTDAGPFAFGTATNGLAFDVAADAKVAKAAAVWKFFGIANGTAGWFRLMGNPADNLGVSTTLPRFDGSIGTSGADLALSNISVAVGVPATVDVFEFSIDGQ